MSFRVVDGICPIHKNDMLLHEVLFLVLMQRNSNSCSRPNILVEKKYFVFSLLYTYIYHASEVKLLFPLTHLLNDLGKFEIIYTPNVYTH